MFYDIEKFKRFESTVQCTERNLVIIKALSQKNKLSDLGKHIKECSLYDRCQHILCSHCKREFRLQYVPKICELIARQKSKSRIYAVTLLEPLNANTTKKIDIGTLKNIIDKLVEYVTVYLQDGWQCQGGIGVLTQGLSYKVFYQAVVKGK